ncbi:hypothetical protein Cgig2_029141 [Carnegiea gigantea]|uniref:DUF4378 domain-containing protein n=1 Tax=Carnegiea gigantea TaxID=171969 RepID=A0A9Q1KLQ0_9CARY|nr:hypothetical protein Cgig2_029141 [Carnegiea gigantea]
MVFGHHLRERKTEIGALRTNLSLCHHIDENIEGTCEICALPRWVIISMDQEVGVMLEVSYSCLTGMQSLKRSCVRANLIYKYAYACILFCIRFSSLCCIEQSKRGAKGTENLRITSIYLEADEEFGAGVSVRGASDYSCVSSVTDDDVYGMKAPGVVARLMGLDALPVPNSLEASAAAFFETRSLGDASFRRKDVDLYPNHQIIYSRHPLDKVGSSARMALDMRPAKMPNRAIEKFQSEILPPKSAKTIPITHHKLLPIESKAAKHIRGQSIRKSLKGSVNTSSLQVSSSRDDSYGAVNNKGKSISLAIQAKVNVQKREGLTPSNRSLEGREEQDETKSTLSFDSQPNGPKTTNKKSSTQSMSSVLRQNNQKQNRSAYMERLAPKTSITFSIAKRPVADGISNRRQKSSDGDIGTCRTASRKSRLQARDCGDKDFPYPGVRNVPRKKRSIDTNAFNRNRVTDKMLCGTHEKSPSHDNMNDVVSFTFSSPITRSLPLSEPARQLAEKSSNHLPDDRGKKFLGSDYGVQSLPGFNGIGSEALGLLLEKKLKELTSNFETFDRNLNERGVSSAECGTWKDRGKKAKEEMQVNDLNSEVYSTLLSNEPVQLRRKNHFQAVEAIAECRSVKAENKQWNDCHLPSPVSILEPSILTESWNSSESTPSSSTEESNQCSSIKAMEVIGLSSLKKHNTMEAETDTSDSASSTASRITSANDSMKPTTWELVYIQDIICNVDLMFKKYMTGQTNKIVNPTLFDQMERQQGGLKKGEDVLGLERKVLFDCVTERLELKCEHFVGGGFKLWATGIATMKRKERLAKEVYKEIQGWRSLSKSMVDEVVNKDMSTKYGRWVEFEVDEFMVGVDIEGQILDSLVLEIVADIL